MNKTPAEREKLRREMLDTTLILVNALAKYSPGQRSVIIGAAQNIIGVTEVTNIEDEDDALAEVHKDNW